MSAVREAVEAVLHGWKESDAWLGDDLTPIVDAVADAVERVPHTVTIRDLSMTEDENVLRFSGSFVEDIANYAAVAERDNAPLYLTVDAGKLKLKVDDHGWSAPIRPDDFDYGSR